MPFYRKNLINLFCFAVRKSNKCVLFPQTEVSCYLSVSAAKNIALYYCHKTNVHKENPDFKSYSDEVVNSLSDNPTVKRACVHLLTNGVNMQLLKKYEKYLSKSPKDSYMKAKLLTEIAFDTSVILPLVKLSVLKLKWILMRSKEDTSLCRDFSDRLSYLCHHLHVTTDILINTLCKHSTLLTMDFIRLSKKMLILKNAGISAEHLIKDLWIFNYQEEMLGDRIIRLQQAGVPVKPWLLRCHTKSFESTLSKWESTQSVLKGRNELTFLAEKLNCSENYVKYMMRRNTLLTTINVPKLEQIADFLYEKGYTPEEVCIFPRVFCSSIKTLNARFDEMYRLKGTLPTMSELCVSAKNYRNRIKNV